MWPFKKKPTQPDWKQEAIQRMREWRPIGGEFSYLGRTCVVTAYWDVWYHDMGCTVSPGIEADYADEKGRIHGIKFKWSESVALMANNP